MLARCLLVAFVLFRGALKSVAFESVQTPTRHTEGYVGTGVALPESVDVAGIAHEDYVVLPARELVVRERGGVKRLLLGFALLAAVIFYFSHFTYPKLMPLQHRLFQWVAENGLPALDMQGMSKAEYIFRRYTQHAEEKPESVFAEVGTLTIALALIFSGALALAFPKRKRVRVIALP